MNRTQWERHRQWVRIKKWLIFVFFVLAVGFAGGYEQSTNDDFGIAILAMCCAVVGMMLTVSLDEDDF